MNKYSTYTKEITEYKEIDCNWYNKNKDEPCYGQVIEDIYYPNGFDNGSVLYYTCEGHYDCIEGGKYKPEIISIVPISDTYINFLGGDPKDPKNIEYCFKGKIVDEKSFTQLMEIKNV